MLLHFLLIFSPYGIVRRGQSLMREVGIISPSSVAQRYHRYHIETRSSEDIVPHPSRFRVQVKKHKLAQLLLTELIHYRGNREVVLSRPCVYGVFSGPIGGFAPRDHLCVGCLRCTTQYPEMVTISPNTERAKLGDSFLTPDYVDTILYEARTGRVPVKGAGYRGKFGGAGWDGLWTDMSEIVRPTRDGIHGREYISTAVDIGEKPSFLEFDERGAPKSAIPRTLSIPLPMVFDVPPISAQSQALFTALSRAARDLETLAIVPISHVLRYKLQGPEIVPLLSPSEHDALKQLNFTPRMIELSGGDGVLYDAIRASFPESLICLRLGVDEDVREYARRGAGIFHFVGNYHGRGQSGRFVLELIREAHHALVKDGIREEVTLLGSGGIAAAEHVPKAIICGLDAVALDTPLLVALQARGECVDAQTSRIQLPKGLSTDWGVQRIKNLMASWRDQLLEVLGAMGLREVRRLRGEVGRAMFQSDLEREAFAGIEGYGS